MKLKFYAKEDLLVTVPGTTSNAGQVARYAGRTLKVETVNGLECVSFPATEAGIEVLAASDIGRRYKLLTYRDKALFPADEATAAQCGVPFVPVEFKDGVWSVKAKAVKGTV